MNVVTNEVLSRGPGKPETRIAIVGLGCRYPGATSPLELWENILARRQQFRVMPEARLPSADYLDIDPTAPDKTYGLRAAVIDGYQFDWAARRIPKSTSEATDIAHWLALDTAIQMLEDAGYSADRLPSATTQVIVGNTLTGEFTRSNTLRLRWPFVRKTLRAAAQDAGLSDAMLVALEEIMEGRYKSVFPPVTEDTLAGGLANTIAGRITNYLNLNGGGYIVDGACCSSLLAVYHGAAQLAAGTADFVIAGGVDISLDPFELVGFAKTKALSPSEMRVYDERGNGFIPGEGCGFVGLKRLADAERDGDKIYAVLDGWGMSSDGRGGITAPSIAGQALALERAYQAVGQSHRVVDFVEGHGTGTAVGDRVELSAIARVLGDAERPRRVGVTSFKSIVGHTKAAAGIGAFIKGVIAVNRRVLPPTAGCEQPHAIFAEEARGLYPLLRGEIRDTTSTMRAGVSAMGFGGINVHVTVASPDRPPSPALEPTLNERALLSSQQDSELFLFSEVSTASLLLRLDELSLGVEKLAQAELADFSAACCRAQSSALPLRAAIVAATPKQLAERMDRLRTLLREAAPKVGEVHRDAEHGIIVGHGLTSTGVGFVFPGQGSHQLGMARRLIERFSWARELALAADGWAAELGTPNLLATMHPDLDRMPFKNERLASEQRLMQTEWAQPAIVLASLLWVEYLARLGVKASHALGHSLGELTACYVAGAYDAKTLIQLAVRRGRCMAGGSGEGAMASLACDAARAEQLLDLVSASGYAVIANHNGPEQTVVSGERAAVNALVELAQREGVGARELPVSDAFHSKRMSGAAAALQAQLAFPAATHPWQAQVISSARAEKLSPDTDLAAYFAEQMLSPVKFVASVQALTQECSLLVEVGPGRVLTRLIAQIAPPPRVICLPVESLAEQSQDFNSALATLHVHGVALKVSELHAQRLIRLYTPVAQRQFIVNPCERPMAAPTQVRAALPLTELAAPEDAIHTAFEHLQNYLAKRGRFIADVIKSDLQHGASTSFDTPTVPHLVATPRATQNVIKLQAPLAPVAHAAPNAASLGNNASRAVLRRLAAEVTGYQEEHIALSMRPVDDLNLDSIKAGMLVANALVELDVADQVDATTLSPLSLEEIAQRIDALRPQRLLNTANTDGQALAAKSALFAAIAEVTGFEAAQLRQDMRLIDDLNMDSIKVGALLAQVATTLGIAGQVDVTAIAGSRLDEIAQHMEHLLPRQAMAVRASAPVREELAPSTRSATSTNWVRAFQLSLRAEPRAEAQTDADSSRVRERATFILHTDADVDLAGALGRDLHAAGINVVTGHAVALQARSPAEVQHLIVLMPREEGSGAPSPMPGAMAQLADMAVQSARLKCEQLSVIQFSGARSKASPNCVPAAPASARAFAASVHLERPTQKIRVLDFESDNADSNVNAEWIAQVLVAESATTTPYSASFHSSGDQRHVIAAEPVDLRAQPPRPIVWQKGEVVVVTGGAKGITAECAFAFAQSYGLTMALIGSTPQHQDSSGEIARTLSRFQNSGLSASYYCCDLADAVAVSGVLRNIESELGSIHGLIHGAGRNRPARAEQVALEAAEREIAPKLQGIINLCAALDPAPLKLVIGLGSIIGVTGMQGNSWYGYSNEALEHVLQRFQAQHPHLAALTLAYSVWADVGMGARLGSTERLAQMGIAAIPVEAGVQAFLDAVEFAQAPSQLVIASRLGGLDTWPVVREPSALHRQWRFIDDVQSYEPGVELVVRARLSLDRDLYLNDHYYRGVYLFPTVFGLEAMAQAAACVLGVERLPALSIQNISLSRPIVVPKDNGALVELHALVLPAQRPGDAVRVSVGIRTEHSGFKHDHFACTFVLVVPEDGRIVAEHALALEGVFTDEPIAQLEPALDLYGGLLFQGPLFQRIQTVYAMSDEGSATRVRRGDAVYFSEGEKAPLVLGDPAFRDALLQTAQLSEKGQYLPVHIERLDLVDLPQGVHGSLRVINQVTGRPDEALHCDVLAFDDVGEVVERLIGYQLKRMHLDGSAPTPADWVNPSTRDQFLLEQQLNSHCQALGLTPPACALSFFPQLGQMDRSRRHISELPLFLKVLERAAGGRRELLGDVEIHWDGDGRPRVSGFDQQSINVSLSHDRSHCMSVGGEGPQACDLEDVESRTAAQWQALLGKRYRALVQALEREGDSADVAGTRTWCAIECGKKALGTARIELELVRRRDSAVLLRARSDAGELVDILSFPLTLTRPRPKICALVVRDAVVMSEDSLIDDHDASLRVGPNGERIVVHQFRIPFKEVTSPRRRLGFPVLADWMGAIRELAISGVAGDIVEDFSSGRWGMVTNHSSVELLGEAACLDEIVGRMWVSRVHGRLNSSVDMHFEWSRRDAAGITQAVAKASMTATWVEITGHGTVELAPLPEYFSEFTAAHLPTTLVAAEASSAAVLTLPFAQLAFQRERYSAPSAPSVQPILLRQKISTSQEESNLVGNIYFSNYYHWQSRTLDRFLHALSEEHFRAAAGSGDLICRRSNVQHLREAMPFDDVEVVMALKALYENGVSLHFDFYRLSESGERIKLAYGTAEMIWAVSISAGQVPVAASLPAWLRDELQARIETVAVELV